MKDILTAIKRNPFVLDGGMGTLLQGRGLSAGEKPERWNVSHSEVIEQIHLEYLQAGADAVTTNTFGANALHYEEEELISIVEAGLACAERAVKRAGKGYVLFDVGPCGRLLKPYGDLDFEDAVQLFQKTLSLVGNRADAILIETMNDCYETKAAVLAAKECSDLPIFVTNVYGADGKLVTGADIPTMVAMLEGLGVQAIGMNCSLGSKQMAELTGEFYARASLPVIVQPNAGLPREEDGKTLFEEGEEEFAKNVRRMVEEGARIVGGCCGTTPNFIRRVKNTINGVAPLPVCKREICAVTSYTHAVEFGKIPLLIGERVNPTGKKRLKQALAEGDTEYVLNEALSQTEKGVSLLDVNVGVPGLDEKKLLTKYTCAIQSVTDVPLQLDSSSPSALEGAMRRYNGKPMVNSVNGKQESMDAVFPLVKKYGGVVVALTLDESGIPQTAEGRLAIARRILKEAKKYGIERKDILFDPLAMAVSADPSAPSVTLAALKLIREKLGANTVLGVSNVSFGLPNREVITAGFFTMALTCGLSAAIMNPFSVEMQKAYYSYLALTGKDENCEKYVSFASLYTPSAVAEGGRKQAIEDGTLKSAIAQGRAESASVLCAELLKTQSPIAIIDGHIVPALDEVGKGFEEKRVYLPQLLMSADAAKAAFEKIKAYLASTGAKEEKRGTVVLATVKGDIHDIGKNIVKALLENYAFRVIDLGKDVPPEKVLESAKEYGAQVVGLSALMTTTVPMMEQTIALLHQEYPACKVVVGGAVLTEEYAKKIGADGYGKDAMASVRFCENVCKG